MRKSIILAAMALACLTCAAQTKLSLRQGGTGSESFTPSTCVRVSDDGMKLESAVADCGTGGSGGTVYYQTLLNATSALTQRPSVNFFNGITCVDNAGATRTDCSLTVPITGTPSLGKIPIGQGDGTAAFADPLVQGLYAAASTSEPNPVGTGAWDGTHLRHFSIDTAGRLNINVNGTVPVSGPLTDTQLRATPVPISGTVTANAGTNLNTSALALETGGNLASIKAKTDNIPALGQALAAGSVPVVMTAAQLSTLTPPAAITNFANETGGNLAAAKTDLDTLAGAVAASKVNVNVSSGTVAATQSGTWNVGTVTTLTSIDLAQASTTSGQTGPLVQGATTTAAPTYTTAKTNPLSLQTDGSLRVAVTSAPTTAVTGTFWQSTQPVSVADGSNTTLGAKADAKSTATDTTAVSVMSVLKEISAMEQAPASRAVTNAGTFAVQATLAAGSAIAGKVGIDQTTDVTTNGVEIAPTSAAAAGITGVVSAAAEGSHVLKASAGNLYSIYVTAGSTAGYLMVFNATSAPGDGAVTPTDCIQVPANTTQSISFGAGPAEVFSTGITAVFSTTGCFTKTVSATAFFHGSVK